MVTKPRDSLCIVYLGETPFPYGLAQWQLFIRRRLIESGARVTIISNEGVIPPALGIVLQPTSVYRGVGSKYASSEIHRRSGFFIRNIQKIKGLMNDLATLTRLKKERKLNGTIIVTLRFKSILYYSILSGILQFKLFLNYVKESSAIATHRKWREWIHNHPINRRRVCFDDVVLPISLYLDFMIQAFERFVVQDVYLYRLVNGEREEMDQHHERSRLSTKQEKIRTYRRLSHNELRVNYMAPNGLLIPLRPAMQDEARFPYKIGEYLASGTFLIMAMPGEIKYYFQSIIL